MIIIRKNLLSTKVSLRDLKIGDCFYLDGLYLFKIDNNFLTNVINIADGKRRMVFNYIEVTSCEKEIN